MEHSGQDFGPGVMAGETAPVTSGTAAPLMTEGASCSSNYYVVFQLRRTYNAETWRPVDASTADPRTSFVTGRSGTYLDLPAGGCSLLKERIAAFLDRCSALAREGADLSYFPCCVPLLRKPYLRSRGLLFNPEGSVSYLLSYCSF